MIRIQYDLMSCWLKTRHLDGIVGDVPCFSAPGTESDFFPDALHQAPLWLV